MEADKHILKTVILYETAKKCLLILDYLFTELDLCTKCLSETSKKHNDTK